jgi:hypothetical protein
MVIYNNIIKMIFFLKDNCLFITNNNNQATKIIIIFNIKKIKTIKLVNNIKFKLFFIE